MNNKLNQNFIKLAFIAVSTIAATILCYLGYTETSKGMQFLKDAESVDAKVKEVVAYNAPCGKKKSRNGNFCTYYKSIVLFKNSKEQEKEETIHAKLTSGEDIRLLYNPFHEERIQLSDYSPWETSKFYFGFAAIELFVVMPILLMVLRRRIDKTVSDQNTL